MSTLGLIFISLGLAFDILGCLGLIRLPDVYNRLQAATKCVTLGTCSILFGTFLMMGFCAAGMKCLLCIVFLLLTSPVAAHAISRGAHHSGVKPRADLDQYAQDSIRGQPPSRRGGLMQYVPPGTSVAWLATCHGQVA